MKSIKGKNVKLFFAGLFLAVTMALVYNNAFFTHTHKLPDGTIIQHAHPYKSDADSSSPFKNHHHTSFEFLVLNNLGVFILLTCLAFFFFDKGIPSLITDHYFFVEYSSYHLYHFYRGPPLKMISF